MSLGGAITRVRITRFHGVLSVGER